MKGSPTDSRANPLGLHQSNIQQANANTLNPKAKMKGTLK